jgi:ABC-type molybdate transport system substrate-binding protein
VVADSRRREQALLFVEFVASPRGQRVLERHGFDTH